MKILRSLVFLSSFLLLMGPSEAQRKELGPSGFNLFSPQQDLEMGKEAAAEVQKTEPMVNNPELTGYLSRLVTRLSKSKRAGTFPFQVAVINSQEINAFALPGGPMFVNTGLIAAAENEAQIAGVLAHEMSHVALRHGTAAVTKAQGIQLLAALGGAVLQGGDSDKNSIWKSLAAMGINAGAGSLLLSNSRSAESQADLNGTRMMSDSGYNPVEMARFFEKLENGKKDGKLANFVQNFTSDHPTPGNRVKSVTEELKYLGTKGATDTDPAALARVKSIVAGLPAPPPKPKPVPATEAAPQKAP